MKKLKIVEQDIHFLLGRRNGFGTNGSPGERRKSGRKVKSGEEDRDPSFNGLCVSRKDGEDWWIGKVLRSDIDEETPTLNVYVINYGPYEEEDVVSLTEVKQYRDNYLKCRYQKGGFPPINNLNCEINCDNLPISSPIKNSSVPTEIIEIDLMNAFMEAGHEINKKEITKWLLCLRTIFFGDDWKDYIESVGAGSKNTLEETLELKKTELAQLSPEKPRRTSGRQSNASSKEKLEKEISTLTIQLQNMEEAVESSITKSIKDSATRQNVTRQKKILSDELKKAIFYIVNTFYNNTFTQEQSINFFYELLNKENSAVQGILQDVFAKKNLKGGANKFCRMLGEIMGVTTFDPMDIVMATTHDETDYEKALERIIKNSSTKEPIVNLHTPVRNLNINVIADALGSNTRGGSLRAVIDKHNSITAVTPHTLLDDAAIGNTILKGIMDKKGQVNNFTTNNYHMIVKFGDKVLIDYTLNHNGMRKNSQEGTAFKLFGNKKPNYEIHIKSFFELNCNSLKSIGNSEGHINIAEGWDRISKLFKNKNDDEIMEADICTKMYKTLMDLGKVLFLEKEARNGNNVNVFVSIDHNISLLAAIILRKCANISINPLETLGATGRYLSIFTKKTDKDLLFGKGNTIPRSQSIVDDPGPNLLDALNEDIYVAPPSAAALKKFEEQSQRDFERAQQEQKQLNIPDEAFNDGELVIADIVSRDRGLQTEPIQDDFMDDEEGNESDSEQIKISSKKLDEIRRESFIRKLYRKLSGQNRSRYTEDDFNQSLKNHDIDPRKWKQDEYRKKYNLWKQTLQEQENKDLDLYGQFKLSLKAHGLYKNKTYGWFRRNFRLWMERQLRSSFGKSSKLCFERQINHDIRYLLTLK